MQSNKTILHRSDGHDCTAPLLKMRRIDLSASTRFASIQASSTETERPRQSHPAISSDSDLAPGNCGSSQAFADDELCALMSMFCKGRNSPPLDTECQSGGSDLVRNDAFEPKLRPESECCIPLVPQPSRVMCGYFMPPPKRFYRGFWFSIVKRVLVKASGGSTAPSS